MATVSIVEAGKFLDAHISIGCDFRTITEEFCASKGFTSLDLKSGFCARDRDSSMRVADVTILHIVVGTDVVRGNLFAWGTALRMRLTN